METVSDFLLGGMMNRRNESCENFNCFGRLCVEFTGHKRRLQNVASVIET